MKRLCGLLLGLGIGVMGVGCGGSGEPTIVTLVADGTAELASVEYTVDGETETLETGLPWELDVELDSEFSVLLQVTNETTEGSVICAVEGLRAPIGSSGEAQATCRLGGSSSELSSTTWGATFTRVNGEVVNVPVERFRAPVSYSPRALVFAGDVAWAAEGGSLTGWDAVNGETLRTAGTRGTNGAAIAPDGVIALAANNRTPNAVILIGPDASETVYEYPDIELDRSIVAGVDQVWVATRDDRIVRIDRVTGEVLGEIDAGESPRLRAATADIVVVCDAEGECDRLEWDGSSLGPSPAAFLARAVEHGDGLLGTRADGTVVHLDSTAETVLAESAVAVHPDGFVHSDGESVVLSSTTDLLILDATTLGRRCEVSSSLDFLGMSDTYLWFRDSGPREWATMRIDDLGCPEAEPGTASPAPAGDGQPDEVTAFPDMVSPGQCFQDQFDGDQFDLSSAPEVVDCDGPHDNEVVSVVELDGPEDASAADIEQLATDACDLEFERFLGRPISEAGDMPLWWAYPEEAEWLAGERSVMCAVFGDLIGTARSVAVSLPGEVLTAVTEVDGVTELRIVSGDDGMLVDKLSSDGLFAQRSPAGWAPDGRSVYFAEGPDDIDRTIMENRGGAPNPVLEGVPAAGSPALDPTGTKLAYIAAPDDGEFDIFVLDLSTGESTRLTTNPDRDTSPRWSPDGTRIAYRARVGGNSDLWLMGADGSGPTRLTRDDAFDGDPAWSPDGTSLAFTSDRSGDFEIYVLNLETLDVRRLTDHPADDEFPSWSADGTKLAFQSTRHGGDSIWVMMADGSDQGRLTWTSPVGYPSIRPGS